MDEYIQKRVGGLKRQLYAGVKSLPVDGMSVADQLNAIREIVKIMIKEYRSCYFDDLLPSLDKIGIGIKQYEELNDHQKNVCDVYFKREIYPITTPLAVDESHPFPFISNHSLSLAVELEYPKVKKNRSQELKFHQIENDLLRFLEMMNV